jgi:molybdopterin converting factor small subunit
MNKVEVRLYASLRKYHPTNGDSDAFTLELGDGAKLGDLVDNLKIPRQEIGVLMINGKWQKENHLLNDGDRIGLFPLIGGG